MEEHMIQNPEIEPPAGVQHQNEAASAHNFTQARENNFYQS